MTSDMLRQARIEQVERHVELENVHDLDAVMGTFGDDASYDDEPWNEHPRSRAEVRRYYEELLRALPDLHVEVSNRYVDDEVVDVECMINGTHEGPWHGLPGTGRSVRLPLCAIYTFTDDRAELAGERIYYDRATALRQVGVFHDPESTRGRILTALTHPISMGQLAIRMLRNKRSPTSERAT